MRTGSGWRFSHDFQTQKLINFQIVFDYTGSNRDFYETRTEDRYVIEPANYGLEFGFNTKTSNSLENALKKADDKIPLLITGSLYLAGYALKFNETIID